MGATGGSGTRAVARILRSAGLYTGTLLNESEDAIRFGEFSDRWIDTYLQHLGGPVPDAGASAMLHELRETVHEHCEPLGGSHDRWGWKEPRSIYLLPFFREHLAGLRFLHVVRDGRDMALSANQNQLRKHGRAAGIPEDLAEPVRSIALWSWINVRAARFGENELGDDYLRVRFEDLCAAPVEATRAILEFAGLTADPAVAVGVVAPPASLGRWRTADERLVEALEEEAGDALAAFGYPLSARGRSLRASG